MNKRVGVIGENVLAARKIVSGFILCYSSEMKKPLNDLALAVKNEKLSLRGLDHLSDIPLLETSIGKMETVLNQLVNKVLNSKLNLQKISIDSPNVQIPVEGKQKTKKNIELST
jgi:hypothetical protein